MKESQVVELLQNALTTLKSEIEPSVASLIVSIAGASRAVEPTFIGDAGQRGLFKVSRIAWAEAVRLSKIKGVRLGSFDTEWSRQGAAALAAALLFNNAAELLKRNGKAMTAEAIYGIFKHGWTAYKRVNGIRNATKAAPKILVAQAASPQGRFLEPASAYALSEHAGNLAGLPSGTMSFKLDLEAAKDRNGKFDSRSRNTSTGDMRGLFQFNQRTWAGVSKVAASAGYALGPWATASYDPKQSAIAAAFLAKDNMDRLTAAMAAKGKTVNRTPGLYYALHQQGVRKVIDLLSDGGSLTAESKQSKQSVAVIRRALSTALA